MTEDLEALALSILRTARRLVRTAVVGTVQAYDAAKQAITVRPDVVERTPVDGELTDIEPPQQPGVPVIHYGGERFGLSYGVVEGDRVVLVYRSASHDEVDADGAVPSSPQSSRRHDLADVVALPGYHPPAAEMPSARYRADGAPVMWSIDDVPIYMGRGDAALEASRADRTDAQLQEIRDLLSGQSVPPWVPVSGDGGAALLAAAAGLWALPSPSVALHRLKVDS